MIAKKLCFLACKFLFWKRYNSFLFAQHARSSQLDFIVKFFGFSLVFVVVAFWKTNRYNNNIQIYHFRPIVTNVKHV